ncbi:hypothetical protein [Actinokineospora enzanensis]|uniref:hypothetical protein n=1 Tax=Actinokineospora enzanensis TaxID=155975 RepID=UPI0003641868|nr:hypothetical protein [Actinokineospora enzanensis]
MDQPELDVRHIVKTDCGLCALWQPEWFASVTDQDAWDSRLSEDQALEGHISAGVFVPLNVGGDGVFDVVVRTGGRTDRESRYTAVSSEPYLLISRGTLDLGGLENVGSHIGDAVVIPLAAGRYTVVVHLIDWADEPGAVDADGNPTGVELCDFMVEIAPEKDPAPTYRSNILTFDHPDSD